MQRFKIEWHGPNALEKEIRRGFIKASSPSVSHNLLFLVNLWQPDGTALSFRSEMRDVADKEEVGVLKIETSSHPHEDELVFELGDDFRTIELIKKLTIVVGE